MRDTETPPAYHDLEAEYEILGELGRGGMAVVYLARDRELQREVAIKVIRAQYVEDEDAMARSAREARTVAALEHPNIVALHTLKRLRDGSIALVMRYVPGRTLKQALREEGPFSVERTERVLHDIAAALGYAHRHGVIHRDVKPENILIEQGTDRALLFDFGIARSLSTDAQLTQTGVALGTPAYMAPEQIDGGALDGRSDQYSLALVGWEMLTGKRPWDGEGLYSVIFKQKNEHLPSLDALRPDVPARLALAIEGALQKNPADRWSTLNAFRAQLTGGSPNSEDSGLAAGERERVTQAVRIARSPAQPDDAGDNAGAATIQISRGSLSPSPHRGSRSRRSARIAAGVGAMILLSGTAALMAAYAGRDSTPSAASDDAAATVVTDPTRAAAPRAIAPVGNPADTIFLLQPAPDSAAARALAGDSALLPPEPVESTALAAMPEEPPRTPPAEDVQPPAPPRPALEVPRVSVVVAGGMHTCALNPDGEVFCWGANDGGQLGTGNLERRSAPARIVGDLRFASISAGISQSCGVTRSGEAFCWGANEDGQLGDGSGTARSTPAKVARAPRLQSVWTGMSHTCGVTPGGDAYCWGGNTRGQLGDGSRSSRNHPVAVVGGEKFRTLAVGWNHTCGINRTGRALCWGDNRSGQLGDGTGVSRASAAPIAASTVFRAIAAGGAHTCAIAEGGEAFCWGRNDSGELGTGDREEHRAPASVQLGIDLSNITAGSAHTCALSRGGEAFCWGRNTYGQLGDGSNADRSSPVAVRGGLRFASLSASGAHTCGTTTAGERFCWGYNLEGQLGDGTRSHRAEPVRARNPAA